MRIAIAFLLFVSVSPALADEVKPSQAACDAKKIGARELAECLRTTADKADRDLAAEIDAATKSIDGKQGLLSTQKARWRHSLADAETAWLTWRDSECQDVAPFEAGIGAKTAGDPRLACIIDQDVKRVADLKIRYP
jgi:uncharacterized protein YecT (DUF1311 family)